MREDRRPTDIRYYHAKIMEDIDDAEWMNQDDDTPAPSVITKECGIYATKDEVCLL